MGYDRCNRRLGRVSYPPRPHPGGDSALIEKSIRERLYSRDLDTVVIPGHGPTTKLGDEARSNPFVRA